MLIIEKNYLYEYKININRKKMNKLRKDLKNKYYKIKKIEFYPDYGDYKEQALNKANGDKIISIDVIKKSCGIPFTILGDICDDYVKAEVAIYPKLYRILKNKDNDELFESLVDWKKSSDDCEYFMEFEKKVLLDEIMKYISFEKYLLLNEESLNAIINLNYKNINKKLLELIPHFERNYKLVKKYVNTENILVKSNKNER